MVVRNKICCPCLQKLFLQTVDHVCGYHGVLLLCSTLTNLIAYLIWSSHFTLVNGGLSCATLIPSCEGLSIDCLLLICLLDLVLGWLAVHRLTSSRLSLGFIAHPTSIALSNPETITTLNILSFLLASSNSIRFCWSI